MGENIIKNIDFLTSLEGLKHLIRLEFMTCLKGKWKEKLFELIPTLKYINKLDKDGNDEVEEEVRELSDIIDDDGINLNYNYDVNQI